MTTASKEKLKLLYIAKMITEETDAEHGLSMTDILGRLEAEGIKAERKGVYRDIEALISIGMDIRKYQRAPVQYGLANRAFSLAELSLLVDAVQSSRFLTDAKAQQLVGKLQKLASSGQRAVLDKEMHVEGRVRTQQESALPNVSTLQQAIRERRKASFRYCEYDLARKLVPRNGGAAYVVTPMHLVYSEGNYYLIAHSDAHGDVRTYRVDRMQRVCVTDEAAAHNEAMASFDAEQFANRSFSMFSGKALTARLRVRAGAMNAVVDRFGADLFCAPAADGSDVATVSVRVMDSPTFYAWVAQFGPEVIIEAPKSLVEGFRAHIAAISAAYE